MNKEEDIILCLHRIEKLLIALLKKQLSNIIENELSDPKIKILYNMTGKYTAREIVKKTDLSLGAISKIWKKWENLGLIIKDGKKYKKII